MGPAGGDRATYILREEPGVEQTFRSATWSPGREKIASGAAGRTQHGRRPFRWIGLHPWPRSKRLGLYTVYRGGSEAWVHIEARGRNGAFPGHAAIIDVLAEIEQWPR